MIGNRLPSSISDIHLLRRINQRIFYHIPRTASIVLFCRTGLFHEGERRTFEIHTGRDEQMQSRRIKVMKEKRAKLPLELRKVFLFSLVSLAHGMKGLVQRFYPIKDIFPEQIQRIRKIKHEIRDWKFNILLQSGKAKDIVCKFSDKRQVIL